MEIPSDFSFFFLPRSLDPPSLHSLLRAVYLGFHSVVFTVGTVESKRASAGKVKCVSDALASTLIPPRPPDPPDAPTPVHEAPPPPQWKPAAACLAALIGTF